MKRVGVDSTGAFLVLVSSHVDHVGSFPLQGDHIKTLPCQVVAWYEGSGVTFALVPRHTGETANRGVARQKEQETQVENGWGCD